MFLNFIKEFKKFAMRGNVIDLAVGVIIGGAFGKIVSSLVADVIMPPLSVLLGGVNFNGLKLVLKKTAQGDVIALNYGAFLQAVIDFVVVAWAIFVFIKLINSLKRKEEQKQAETKPTREEILLTEIRDLLKKKV